MDQLTARAGKSVVIGKERTKSSFSHFNFCYPRGREAWRLRASGQVPARPRPLAAQCRPRPRERRRPARHRASLPPPARYGGGTALPLLRHLPCGVRDSGNASAGGTRGRYSPGRRRGSAGAQLRSSPRRPQPLRSGARRARGRYSPQAAAVRGEGRRAGPYLGGGRPAIARPRRRRRDPRLRRSRGGGSLAPALCGARQPGPPPHSSPARPAAPLPPSHLPRGAVAALPRAAPRESSAIAGAFPTCEAPGGGGRPGGTWPGLQAAGPAGSVPCRAGLAVPRSAGAAQPGPAASCWLPALRRASCCPGPVPMWFTWRVLPVCVWDVTLENLEREPARGTTSQPGFALFQAGSFSSTVRTVFFFFPLSRCWMFCASALSCLCAHVWEPLQLLELTASHKILKGWRLRASEPQRGEVQTQRVLSSQETFTQGL